MLVLSDTLALVLQHVKIHNESFIESIKIHHVKVIYNYSRGNQEHFFKAMKNKEDQLVKITWQLTNIPWVVGNFLFIVH